VRGIGCHGSRVNSVKGLAATQTNGAECQPVANCRRSKSVEHRSRRLRHVFDEVVGRKGFKPFPLGYDDAAVRTGQTAGIEFAHSSASNPLFEFAQHYSHTRERPSRPRTIEALLGLPLLLNVARSFSVRDSFSVGKRAVYRNAHHHSLEPNQNDRKRGASKIAGTTNPA